MSSKSYTVIGFHREVDLFYKSILNMEKLDFSIGSIINEIFIKLNQTRIFDLSVVSEVVDWLSFNYDLSVSDIEIFEPIVGRLVDKIVTNVFLTIPHLPSEMLVLERFLQERDLIVSIKDNAHVSLDSRSRSFSPSESFGW